MFGKTFRDLKKVQLGGSGHSGGVFRKKRTVSILQNCLKLRFQNEYNKVEIALRVVQFWSEIKLVITCDFIITRLILDQMALHSVQLPLLTQSGLHAW
jgi:hypothetical protein